MSKGVDEVLDGVCVFSGSSHRELATEICQYLGITLSDSRVQRFSNDNLYVQLLRSVREKEVFIIQSLCPPVSDHLMELFLLLDAARSASARRINTVIPYFSYSRSDKKDEPRISIAARLIGDLLRAAGASHILTMTLHSPQVHGFFSIPTDHLTSRPILTQHFRGRDLSNAVVAAPDIGYAKRATKFARALGISAAAGIKRRIDDYTVELDGIIGDVRGKEIILVDDEVVTGGSVLEMIKLLREQEDVTKITLVCTHGLFSGQAIERLTAFPELQEIVTTNTVPIPPEKRVKNMTVLSIAPIFGEAIFRNLKGQSLNPLFSY